MDRAQKYLDHPLEQLRLKAGLDRKTWCQKLNMGESNYYKYLSKQHEIRCDMLAGIQVAARVPDRVFWSVIKQAYGVDRDEMENDWDREE